MSEFQPISSLEMNFTIAREPTEPTIQKRITEVSKKATESGIFNKSEIEQKRADKLDEIVMFASGNVIPSYRELIDRSSSGRDQTKIEETFDILRRGFSLAINNDEELQSSLCVGGIGDVLPEAAKYDNMGHSRFDLGRGILEVTITTPEIREIYSKVSEIRDDYDLSVPKERKKAAEEIEPFYDQLLSLGKDARSGGFREEWMQAKAYFGTEIGVLYGELSSSDGSVDKKDETAVFGRELIKAAEQMASAAKDISKNVGKMDRPKPDKSTAEAKIRSRSGVDLLKYSELPRTEEEQFEYVEERLRIIEGYASGCVKQEISLNELTLPLFTLLTTEGLVSQRLLDMIKTRLTLKDVGSAMRANNGSMGEGGRELISAISRVAQMGYDMSPEVMKAFFSDFGDSKLGPGQEKLRTNLKTAEAWDLMERANFEYQSLVNEIFAEGGIRSERLNQMIAESGMTLKELRYCKPLVGSKGTMLEGQVFNYYLDSEGGVARAAIVKQYMVETLMKKYGISQERAEKSVFLAEEMYAASLESFVVDWDFINGDQYAEMVQLQFLRKLDGSSNSKGKLVGPSISIQQVKSLTPGWIRSFCGERDPSKKITSEKILDSLNKGKLTKKEQFQAHFISVICGKVWAAKNLICSESTPLTKDILKTQYWKGINDYFNKVDGQIANNHEKDGITKTAYVAGLFQLILSSRDSEWTPNDIRLLKRILTKDIITDEDSGTGRPFLTIQQWDWIENTLRVSKNSFGIGLLNTVTKIFGGKK